MIADLMVVAVVDLVSVIGTCTQLLSCLYSWCPLLLLGPWAP